MENINYEEFSKVKLRVAEILSAEQVEGSEKLIKLIVNSGEVNLPALPTGQAGGRQVIAGIGKTYEPSSLIGKKIIIVANLEPRKLMGLESQGMLLATSTETIGLFYLSPSPSLTPGPKSGRLFKYYQPRHLSGLNH